PSGAVAWDFDGTLTDRDTTRMLALALLKQRPWRAAALVIALAMKVVGVLLITALLIIPAAAARQFCQSPTAMAAGAALIGVLAVNGGLAASFFWDTPAGPSAVLVAVLVFMLGWLRRRAD
ncbi:MAG TPA: metal ABC transporter permease, partial [Cellvibrionaceae bacterium]|nr:metal ABC transporter permease [Cellvibrionaceae bacterium]